MRRHKNRLGRKVTKRSVIQKVKQNQNVTIHLGNVRKRKSRRPMPVSARPIIQRFYAPTPQPSMFEAQTNRTLDSLNNTIANLKREREFVSEGTQTSQPTTSTSSTQSNSQPKTTSSSTQSSPPPAQGTKRPARRQRPPKYTGKRLRFD